MHPIVEGLFQGDRRSLARAISIVDDDEPDSHIILRQIFNKTGNAKTVGFTGAGGAGNIPSIARETSGNRAVQPQDRDVRVCRMHSAFDDWGLFHAFALGRGVPTRAGAPREPVPVPAGVRNEHQVCGFGDQADQQGVGGQQRRR